MPATIMIIDEDRAFTDRLALMLAQAGYMAFGSAGKDEALDNLETHKGAIDLAIVDFHVPGISGPELIGAIQRRMPAAKIIATVPGEGPDLTDVAARTGADRVMRRPRKGEPIDRELWIGVVEGLLGRAGRGAA